MTPKHKSRILQFRVLSNERKKYLLKRAERERRVRVRRLRLSQRLRLDIYNWKMSHSKRYAEHKKKLSAKLETAKLNRTQKRRRKK